MPVDLSVFDKIKTKSDYDQANAEFMQRQALGAAQISAALNKGNSFSNIVGQAAIRAASGNATDDDINILHANAAIHPRSNIANLGLDSPPTPAPIAPVPAPVETTVLPQSALPVADSTPRPIAMGPVQAPAAPSGDIPDVTQSVIKPPPTGKDYLLTLPPKRALLVQAIGEGKEKSTTVLSRMSSADKQDIIADVMTAYPDYSSNQIGAVREFNIGKLGNQARSLNVAVSHLDTLKPAIDALNNRNMTLFNQFGNAYATATGNPAPTNFDAAKQIVGDEIVKGIVGAGGTGGDREKAQDALNKANSPAQLAGVVKTYQSLLGGQLGGLKLQYKHSTGKDDFDSLLSEETKAELEQPTKASILKTPPLNAKLIGTAGGKKVYKAPDGSTFLEQ